jgi:hypothetical protein
MFRLPEPWTTPELVSDVVAVDGIEVHRAGVSTVGADAEEICGAAAGADGPTTDRAWFELLERVSGLEAIHRPSPAYCITDGRGVILESWPRADVFPESDAPDRWRYARSNGVAIHADFDRARDRAFWELAERDRLVRSWHGHIRPVRLERALGPLDGAKSFEWAAYAFPEDDRQSFSHGIDVVGVFGFPKRDDVPFVFGFSARPDLDRSVDAAAAEALQVLAFLWGEPVSDAAPAWSPTSTHHLERYQVRGAHETVRRWLEGTHARFVLPRSPAVRAALGFVDVTPAWLPNGLRVVKAVCRSATPLIFGESPLAGHLPADLRVHPIA